MTDGSAPGDKPRILLVDDERFNLNTLHGLLKEEYKIMVATGGEQALKAALTGRPDLILLDINMPDMDGYEVCRRLKADPLMMGVPIIFITGLADADDETRGLELGAADYITKPVTISVGVATARPSEAGGLAPLVQTADSMLYACKSAGRNCARGVQLTG